MVSLSHHIKSLMGERQGLEQAPAQSLRRTRAPAPSLPTIGITELLSYEHFACRTPR